jgi:integrase
MSVVARKRKTWTAYYVVFIWHGKKVWEYAGRDRRRADSLDGQRAKEVKAGTYHPDAGKAGAFTLRQWFESWLVTRDGRSVKDEERWIRRHVLTRARFAELQLADAKPADFADLVRELKTSARSEKDPRPLSDKSISNVVGVLQAMLGDAHRADHCAANLLKMKRGTLNREPARAKETYTPGEVAVLIRNVAIPEEIRVLNALAFLTGMREGEVCGRRWRDLADDALPLWCLDVADQYGGAPLKTGRPRVVPVHPELAEILTAWASAGFELLTTRKPTPDDFIVPLVTSRAKTAHHTRSTFYKAFVRACKAVKVRPRSLHSTRHTFISMARRGGALKDRVEKITHNAKGDMVDRYTHFDWEPLCDAVLKIRLDGDAHQQPQLPPGNRGGRKGPAFLRTATDAVALPQTTESARGSIPGASTPNEHKTRASGNGVNFGVNPPTLPARLKKALLRTSPRAREGLLVRHLANVAECVAAGDKRATRKALKNAARQLPQERP